MCGIAGFIDKRCSDFESHLTRMTRALIHRGPDGGSEWYDREYGIALGHRRLSIIDLSDLATQPMSSASGRFVISFNGEIYNYREIRQQLESEGIAFKTSSDTEVMIEAFDHWGIERSLSEFNGMFAFALFDRQSKDFYLVRDRLGVKPLFYTIQNNKLFFASELKGICAHPEFSKEISRYAVELYMKRGYIEAPFSIYEGVKKVLPGTLLSWNLSSSLLSTPRVIQYWMPDLYVNSIQEQNYDIANKTTTLNDLLRDSIRLRMVADVPLGAFLSGGIDSSLVVAIMQELSNKPVKTFTAGFHEPSYDEASHARTIANILGTEHTELYITPNEAMSLIPELPKFYDEPFGDSSMLPTLLISELTRKHVTVSLSGDGGDELFLGYGRYYAAKSIWGVLKCLPVQFRNSLSKIIQTASPKQLDTLFNALLFLIPQRYHIRSPGEKLHRLSRRMGALNFHHYYSNLMTHWPPGTVIWDQLSETNLESGNPDLAPDLDIFNYMSLTDIKSYLPDDILVKLDRASMTFSLEAREPLLDYRIVEYALSLPTELKYRAGTSKWILKKVLYKYLPETLFARPKKGFSVPIDSWLRNELYTWGSNLLNPDRLQQEGFLNPKIINHYWQEHQAGRANHMYLLWSALMFQAWLESSQQES